MEMIIQGMVGENGGIKWFVIFPKGEHPFWVWLHRVVIVSFWGVVGGVTIWG